MTAQAIEKGTQAQVVEEKRTNEFAGLTADARHELAVRRIRERWTTVAGAILAIGDVLVDACHEGAEKSALAKDADENELFARITRSLGTLSGGPTEKTLTLARRVAAAARVVKSHFWTVVPYTHRAKLVVLSDPKAMAAGAKQAVEYGWTVKQVEAWVKAELAKTGHTPKKRGRTLPATEKDCERLGDLSSTESLQRISADYTKLTPAKRKRVREKVARAEAALAQLRRHLAKLGDE